MDIPRDGETMTMRTRVEVRIGRATRGTWVFPALVASLIPPVAVYLWMNSRPETGVVSDMEWWTPAMLCLVLPLVPLAVVGRAWRGLGRGMRIGATFTMLAGTAAVWPVISQEFALSVILIATEVDFRMTSGPTRAALATAPETAADAAWAAGDERWLGVVGFVGFRSVPGVENDCALHTPVRVAAATGPYLFDTPAFGRFRASVAEYARRYNLRIGVHAGLSPADLARSTGCAITYDSEPWPSR